MNSNLIENRHIRVFISSTFLDMQDERDYLMKRTFPKLRRLASERDVTLTEVDLRWGITEEESRSGKIVEICFREIENSIPFFIGIIGNRYGWVPRPEDLSGEAAQHFDVVNDYVARHLSVTEMEMQFGVLSREDDMHAYFYIKEQEEEADNPEMLKHLKEEVWKSKYPSSTYKSIEDLSAQIESAFLALLDTLFPDTNLSEWDKERIGQRSFMNQLCQNYIRDVEAFEALDTWLETPGSSHFVVTGNSGLGKSALLANWIKEKLCDFSCRYNVIYHFEGNGGSNSSREHITRTLVNEINEAYGWQYSRYDEKLIDLFHRVSCEGSKPLLIVIDAINQIVDIDNAKLISWLPEPTKNIKILFSTLEGDRTMEVFKNRNYPIFTLDPLEEEYRSQLVRSYLRLYGKSLTEVQVMRIVTHPQCENTLVLKTLLDELIKFGVYENLDDKIECYLQSESINDYYQMFIASYEEEYGREEVKNILSVIAVSKRGLTEHEILSISEVAPLLWSQIYCSFASQFVSKNGVISFSHTYVREAAERRYLKEKVESDNFRKKIIEAFKTLDSPRAWEELLYQYYSLEDVDSLSVTLQRLCVLNHMVKYHPEKTALYIRSMIDQGFPINKYRDIIRNGDDVDRAYVLYLHFFVYYFSAYDLGMSLCEDYQQALEDSNCHLPGTESLEKFYIWKGKIYSKKERYSEAQDAFSEAYYVCKRLCGENNPYTEYIQILSLNERMVTYIDSGDHNKAIEFGKNILDFDLKKYGEYDIQTATAFNNIAVAYEKCGDYRKAIEYGNRALDIRRRIFGENHPETANSYSNVGLVYYKCGDSERALDDGKKALEIRLRIFGENHNETATSYNNVGLAYGSYGNPQKELEYLERALEIKLRILGSQHQDVITLYKSIGLAYEENEDFKRALDSFLRALNICLEIYGEIHSETATNYMNVAASYECLGDHQKALEYAQKAVNAGYKDK